MLDMDVKRYAKTIILILSLLSFATWTLNSFVGIFLFGITLGLFTYCLKIAERSLGVKKVDLADKVNRYLALVIVFSFWMVSFLVELVFSFANYAINSRDIVTLLSPIFLLAGLWLVFRIGDGASRFFSELREGYIDEVKDIERFSNLMSIMGFLMAAGGITINILVIGIATFTSVREAKQSSGTGRSKLAGVIKILAEKINAKREKITFGLFNEVILARDHGRLNILLHLLVIFVLFLMWLRLIDSKSVETVQILYGGFLLVLAFAAYMSFRAKIKWANALTLVLDLSLSAITAYLTLTGIGVSSADTTKIISFLNHRITTNLLVNVFYIVVPPVIWLVFYFGSRLAIAVSIEDVRLIKRVLWVQRFVFLALGVVLSAIWSGMIIENVRRPVLEFVETPTSQEHFQRVFEQEMLNQTGRGFESLDEEMRSRLLESAKSASLYATAIKLGLAVLAIAVVIVLCIFPFLFIVLLGKGTPAISETLMGKTKTTELIERAKSS